MAANIKDPAAPKRGRPTKEEIARRKNAEAAAQREMDAKEGRTATAPANAPAPAPAPRTGAAFGHNRINEPGFLRHVQAHRAHEEKISVAKLAVKALLGQKKDMRNNMKADGIVLREFDQALEELETERVDLLAQQERLDTYRVFLGLPTLSTAESAKLEKSPAQIWHKRGNIAGRLGEARAIPDGCPPENGQDFLHGFDKGLDALKEDATARADAYAAAAPAGSAKAAPASSPEAESTVVQAPAFAEMLVLKEEHFQAGTALDDCNRLSLMPDLLEAWTAAANVVVIIGGKKRVLKEPAAGADPAYEDTGEADVDVTEPVTLAPEEELTLAAIAEAEPGIVETVVEDDEELGPEGMAAPIEDNAASDEMADDAADPEAEKIAEQRAADEPAFD